METIPIRNSDKGLIGSYFIALLLSAILGFSTSVKCQNVDSLVNVFSKCRSVGETHTIFSFLYDDERWKNAKIRTVAMEKIIAQARAMKNDTIIANALSTNGFMHEDIAEFKPAIDYFLQAFQFSKTKHIDLYAYYAAYGLGLVFKQIPNYQKAIQFLNIAQAYIPSTTEKNRFTEVAIYSNKLEAFLEIGQYDSSLFYGRKAVTILNSNPLPFYNNRIQNNMGATFAKLGQVDSAFYYFERGIKYALNNDKNNLTCALDGKAQLLIGQKKYGAAKQLLIQSLRVNNSFHNPVGSISIEITGLLSDIYGKIGQYDSAYYFSAINKAHRDSVLSIKRKTEIETMVFSTQLAEIEADKRLQREKAYADIEKQKWLRNIFISATILALVFAFLIYNSLKVRRKLEMEKMRNRLSRDLHDDIGSTLSSINILSKVAKTTVERNERDRAIESLEKINERSQRLLLNMSDLVWKMNPTNDTLGDVMSRMREYAVSILEAKDIAFTLDFPKVHSDIKLPMEVKNNLYLIFKEAVNNLAKYSDCTMAKILMRFEVGRLSLSISDNGKGFDQIKLTHEGGLLNMKMRAEEMKAELVIISEPGSGTEIRMNLPLF